MLLILLLLLLFYFIASENILLVVISLKFDFTLVNSLPTSLTGWLHRKPVANGRRATRPNDPPRAMADRCVNNIMLLYYYYTYQYICYTTNPPGIRAGSGVGGSLGRELVSSRRTTTI